MMGCDPARHGGWPRGVRRGGALQMVLAALAVALAAPAAAHDPVFGLGPHVLYKGGFEASLKWHTARKGDSRDDEVGLELTYGLTGDWAAGVELPWVRVSEAGASRAGRGDLQLFTKWRFWRRDGLGVQESAAVAARVWLDTAVDGSPRLGTGARDWLAGLAYGYESRRWYRWASLRWRRNGDRGALDRGDRILVDLVGGWRPRPGGYLEPDTVWLLELNGEITRRSRRGGAPVADSGGQEWFVSPGIFWTLRNYAVKAGVQIPVRSDLNGSQSGTDWRALLVLEGHW